MSYIEVAWLRHGHTEHRNSGGISPPLHHCERSFSTPLRSGTRHEQGHVILQFRPARPVRHRSVDLIGQ